MAPCLVEFTPDRIEIGLGIHRVRGDETHGTAHRTRCRTTCPGPRKTSTRIEIEDLRIGSCRLGLTPVRPDGRVIDMHTGGRHAGCRLDTADGNLGLTRAVELSTLPEGDAGCQTREIVRGTNALPVERLLVRRHHASRALCSQAAPAVVAVTVISCSTSSVSAGAELAEPEAGSAAQRRRERFARP